MLFRSVSCTSMTEIDVPDSVTLLDAYAFSGITGLKTVTVPESVEEIGEGLFAYSTGVTVNCRKGSMIDEYCSANSIATSYMD